ncbi:arabinofuranosidase catalytic domain-containing protein [Nonomuraea sp. CA-141351]|uniref:arabinofuranosidase catalytic domain-containing protein n=1 Tax=Nonomuraea sp. CA-141351 TaxID=3239996 RepID=UPI003D932D89
MLNFHHHRSPRNVTAPSKPGRQRRPGPGLHGSCRRRIRCAAPPPLHPTTKNGPGAMDAIYFGTSCWFGGCSGTGPWVQADLEWGLYPGGSTSWNPNQRAFTSKYVTAMLKNNGTTRFAIKGANARSGGTTTLWDGGLPSGYSPMKNQNAIILGSGGDRCVGNTNLSAGTFYEAAMVSGYPSDPAENAVQADIVAAGYR